MEEEQRKRMKQKFADAGERSALNKHAVSGRSEQLVCCENCTHFDKQEKTCGETCVNWSAYNKAN